MRRLCKSFLFVLLAGALAVSAFAQSSTANVRGKVTNDQGTALPGATVTAVGTASGFVKTSTAGPDGAFQLGGLTPGEYIITVEVQGFQERAHQMRPDESRAPRDDDPAPPDGIFPFRVRHHGRRAGSPGRMPLPHGESRSSRTGAAAPL